MVRVTRRVARQARAPVEVRLVERLGGGWAMKLSLQRSLLHRHCTSVPSLVVLQNLLGSPSTSS